MRGADGGRWSRICALPALWVGLLYDSESLDAAWDLVKHWSIGERERLRHEVPRLALDAVTPDGQSMRDFAERVLDIAAGGLTRRAQLNSAGDNEGGFLDPLRDVIATGILRPTACSPNITTSGTATSAGSTTSSVFRARRVVRHLRRDFRSQGRRLSPGDQALAQGARGRVSSGARAASRRLSRGGLRHAVGRRLSRRLCATGIFLYGDQPSAGFLRRLAGAAPRLLAEITTRAAGGRIGGLCRQPRRPPSRAEPSETYFVRCGACFGAGGRVVLADVAVGTPPARFLNGFVTRIARWGTRAASSTN